MKKAWEWQGLISLEMPTMGEKADGKDNVAQFEFIPWILGQCVS